MGAPPSLHPTDQTLSAYGLGKLDDDSAEAVNAHLESCPDCRRRTSEMTSDSFLGRFRDGRSTAGSFAGLGGPLPAQSLAGAEASIPDGTLPPELADHRDYKVIRELGRGGMGVVYLAENTLMGRMEVLKVMARQMTERPEVLDRFLREIRAVARLRHPNIVAAYHAFRVDQSLVFAMEHVDGFDLAKMVKSRGPLPVAHACLFAHQAAQGLQHAHEEGMVHRDIKPGNLMVSRRGERAVVKVLDFGLAKAAREGEFDGALTHAGQMLGTPDFIAPEQIVDAQSADIRADIYSLGCTLYYLLNGGPPFRGSSLYDLFQAHHSMDAKPLNFARPEVPSELAALVAKMMAKEPARRFQTPAEVSAALTPFTKKGTVTFKPAKTDVSRVAAPAPRRPSPIADPTPPVPAPSAASPELRNPAEPERPESRWSSLIDFRASEPKAEAPAPEPGRDLPGRPWPWIVAASGFVAVILGIVIYIATNKGQLKIVSDDPSATFKIVGETIMVEGHGESISIRPGEHELLVKRGGMVVQTRNFVIKRGKESVLNVELLDPRTKAMAAMMQGQNPGMTMMGMTDIGVAQTEKAAGPGMMMGMAGAGEAQTEMPAGPGMPGMMMGMTGESPDANLVAFYDFDDATATDRSGHGHHGTLSVDPPSFTPNGHEKGALSFDPKRKNSIVVPVDINPSVMPQITMGGWIKPNSSSLGGPVLSHDNRGYDRQIGIDTRGGPGFRWSAFTGRGVLGGTPVVAGQWTFVAMRHDQATNKLILGVDGRQFTAETTFGHGSGRVFIGSNPRLVAFFNGSMDDLFIYKGFLSDAKIADIRARGRAAILPPSPSGPVPLFNGKDLAGWDDLLPNGSEWKVTDGILEGHGSGKLGNPGVLVLRRQNLKDFRLRAKVRYLTDGFGWIEIRRSSDGETCNGYFVADGLWPTEQRVPAGSVFKATGFRYGKGAGGWTEAEADPIGVNEWFDIEIMARGSTVITSVNGKEVARYTDPEGSYRSGAIALACRWDATVQYQSITVEEISDRDDRASAPAGAGTQADSQGWKPLFNGKDLTDFDIGWPAQHRWSVVDGTIVSAGPGSFTVLNTKRHYSDFHLQFETMPAEGVAGSIDFRWKGPESAGNFYAVSIAGSVDGPGPQKTGNIQLWVGGKRSDVATASDPPARLAPGRWFPMEIIAVGDTIRVLVQGREVSRYKDPARTHTSARSACSAGPTRRCGSATSRSKNCPPRRRRARRPPVGRTASVPGRSAGMNSSPRGSAGTSSRDRRSGSATRPRGTSISRSRRCRRAGAGTSSRSSTSPTPTTASR